jgi:hypothetical protein
LNTIAPSTIAMRSGLTGTTWPSASTSAVAAAEMVNPGASSPTPAIRRRSGFGAGATIARGVGDCT